MNIIQIMKSLADETRLRIVHLLENQELNVNELVTILEMGQSRISRHLKILSEAGVVKYRRDGLWSFYYINESEKLSPFLRETTALLQELPVVAEDIRRMDLVLKHRTMQTSRLFDRLAGNWKHIKAELFGGLDLIGEIFRLIPPSQSIVDIGCGTGDLLLLLKNKADEVIGVDNSLRMLEEARVYLNQEGSIDLRLGNIEHLPLGDEEVESAVINMVLHHSDAPLHILKEAGRVLKKRGYLVLADFKKHNQEYMRTQYGDRYLGFDPDELKDYFRKSGFTVIKEKKYPLPGGLEIILFITIKEV